MNRQNKIRFNNSLRKICEELDINLTSVEIEAALTNLQKEGLILEGTNDENLESLIQDYLSDYHEVMTGQLTR